MGVFLCNFKTAPGRSTPAGRFASIRTARPCLVYDEFGREQQRWQLPLAQGGQPVYYYNGNPQLTNAYVQGHLLVVPLGHKIFGLDPLGLAGTGNRQLWSQDLTDSSGGFREESGQPRAGAAPAWDCRPSFSTITSPARPRWRRSTATAYASNDSETSWRSIRLPASCCGCGTISSRGALSLATTNTSSCCLRGPTMRT